MSDHERTACAHLDAELLEELEPIDIAPVTAVTEGDSRIQGDDPDDNIVWGQF